MKIQVEMRVLKVADDGKEIPLDIVRIDATPAMLGAVQYSHVGGLIWKDELYTYVVHAAQCLVTAERMERTTDTPKRRNRDA